MIFWSQIFSFFIFFKKRIKYRLSILKKKVMNTMHVFYLLAFFSGGGTRVWPFDQLENLLQKRFSQFVHIIMMMMDNWDSQWVNELEINNNQKKIKKEKKFKKFVVARKKCTVILGITAVIIVDSNRNVRIRILFKRVLLLLCVVVEGRNNNDICYWLKMSKGLDQ